MTEAASQHPDSIGRTTSLCKRYSTSARRTLLPGPAGPFLLKDVARPGSSHTLMTGSVAPKFSARPGGLAEMFDPSSGTFTQVSTRGAASAVHAHEDAAKLGRIPLVA